NSNDVAVFLGNGDGTFRERGRWATGTNAFYLTAADFDGDGQLDLATANTQSGDVSVLLGNGDGTFRDELRFGAGIRPAAILGADFNGDRRPDLAVLNGLSHDISVLLGRGDGTFQPETTLPRQGATYPQGVVALDFNGDGTLDLATVSFAAGDLFV